jgi:hypothetical protein
VSFSNFVCWQHGGTNFVTNVIWIAVIFINNKTVKILIKKIIHIFTDNSCVRKVFIKG